ncbi:uncharacterized protein FIBRA_08735 [Fibroporia radiculosa]|uniref:Major facilitator superfamily (MFS) profile domain-containing protein n=1 Tax=Fibroporia radiculosa TaxID=599839 RepID=J4GXC1_9APHY|nr:uncharacterized protein FIBRA_08735 [Fibroporia radiculosa]CCM06470.1 predicted protein [Fibroporia radiculosa]
MSSHNNTGEDILKRHVHDGNLPPRPAISPTAMVDAAPHTSDSHSDLEKNALSATISMDTGGEGATEADPPVPDNYAEIHGLAHSMKPWEIHVTFFSLAIGGFLAALDQTIVSTSMPTIASEFFALNQQSWIATSYLLTNTVFQPFFGRACELWGCKAVLFVSITIFKFGSLMTATAQNFIWLCCARAVAGIGGAGLMVSIMIMISQMVPLRERGRYMGVMYARVTLASVLGPVLGGIFTHDVTWRWCFYINLPIGSTAVLVLLFFIPKVPSAPRPASVGLRDIDLLGIALLSASVTALLLALTWGSGVYPWGSARIIALLAAGAGLIPLFVLWKRRVRACGRVPVIPLEMFRHRNVVASTVNYFFTHMSLFGITVYVPTYFQLVKGDSQLISGLELLPFVVPLSFSSVLVDHLVVRTGWVRPWLWAGGAIFTLGAGLGALIDATTPRGEALAILAVAGSGMGFVYQTNTLSAQGQVGRGELPRVTTMTMWSKSLGGIIGIAVMGTILQNVLVARVRADPRTAPYAQDMDSTALLARVPPRVQYLVRGDYGVTFSRMMLAATAFAAAGLAVLLFAQHVPLDRRAKDSEDPYIRASRASRRSDEKAAVAVAGDMEKESGNDGKCVSKACKEADGQGLAASHPVTVVEDKLVGADATSVRSLGKRLHREESASTESVMEGGVSEAG